jgi:hypothetical protein
LDETGLFLPLFEALADPAVVARLAGAAEEAGWDPPAGAQLDFGH